jgi:hypothetical protein
MRFVQQNANVMNVRILGLLLLFASSLHAQVLIKGSVKDEKNQPLAGANVYLKGTYTGTTSDSNGNFSFNTSLNDTCMLVAGFLGYETIEKIIPVNQKVIHVDFRMKESASELHQVTITAGTFEAGDRKRAMLLSSLDIVTTANAEGDIYGALNMLPGAQTEGETGKIIVRGGESSEMKTFMDGMLISSPYTSAMPDIPARGRFSPSLFNGVLFSTGGYSAEYGQALSSVLELSAEALAEESLTSLSLLNVGGGLGYTHRFNSSSVTLEADYYNMAPYFAMAKDNLDWEETPESVSGQFRFRQKTGKEGMVKSFLSYSNSNSKLNYPNYDTHKPDRITLKDKNLFQSTTLSTPVGEKWIVKTGLAFNLTEERYKYNENQLTDQLNSIHTRVSLNHFLTESLTLKFGVESFFTENKKRYDDGLQENYLQRFRDHLLAGFVETDIRLSNRTALRIGSRVEHSGYLDRANLAPRVSLACRIAKDDQIAFAYGKFYQQADNDYLITSDSLDFENATHYILNYQYSKDDRLFRIEAYHKQYDRLVQFDSSEDFVYNRLSNQGNGFARGIDIFWRDKKTFRSLDYWVSCSFLDTERKYQDFPVRATPVFASKYNLSFVAKYWISKLNTQIGATYKYRSGRPYYNPNNPGFMSDRTRPFNDMSINCSHLTNIFGNFTIIYFSCSNLMGFNNIYGYHYEKEPDGSGIYQKHAIQPYAKRTFIIGVFISIK